MLVFFFLKLSRMLVYVYIEAWRTKGSPLAGCFGSTSGSAGGLSFSYQNLAEFGQT